MFNKKSTNLHAILSGFLFPYTPQTVHYIQEVAPFIYCTHERVFMKEKIPSLNKES